MVEILTESNSDLGKRNLGVMLTYESVAGFLLTLMLFVAGGLLYGSDSARIAYGENFVNIGGYLIFCGFFCIFTSFGGLYAGRYHNRVVILIVMFMMMIEMVIEVGVCLTIRSTIDPEFEFVAEEDCLTQIPSEENVENVCSQYFASNQTLALWNLWETWVSKAQAEDDSLDGIGDYMGILLNIQSAYACCGFSRPQMCQVNRTLAPETVDLYKSGSVEFPAACGTYYTDEGVYQQIERWYPPTNDCDDLVRSLSSLYYGGCPFDLPFGETCTIGWDEDPYVKGCAAGLQSYINKDLYSIADLLIFVSVCQAIFLTTMLCFFFKRKMIDVSPVQRWQIMKEDLLQ